MADPVAIPPEVLVQHVAVLGKTGSGKTSTAKLAVEQIVADGGRVCVLDPIKSDWWGLTSSAEGKKAGLPFYILGGPHGHVPLPSSSGKAIGELVASGALPLSIIDMADFEAGGLQRFFVDFAPALLKGMRGVLHLVMEEAHSFAPKERAGFGQETQAIHYAKKLATAGRSKGIRLIVTTQRTQGLHNDLLNSCETMIVHRVIAPGDKKVVLGWLEDNATKEQAREVSQSLSSLPTGTAWIYSGEAGIFERKVFPRISTFDNSATPTNDTAVRQVKTAPVDQDKLRSIIGTAITEAEANDPAKLKAEIARLREVARKLVQGNRAADAVVELETARTYIRNLEEKVAEQFQECERLHKANTLWLEKARSVRDGLLATADELEHYPDFIRENVGALRINLAPAPAPRASAPAPAPAKAAPAAPRRPTAFIDGLTAPQQKVLASLAFWKSVGHDTPTREQIAGVAGYSADTGNFRAIVGSLGTAGHVTIPERGRVSLAAGAPYQPLDPEEAAKQLRAALSAPELKLVDAASGARGAMSRHVLAAETGYSADTGNFRALVGSLCTLGVLVKTGVGAVSISDWAREVLKGGGHV